MRRAILVVALAACAAFAVNVGPGLAWDGDDLLRDWLDQFYFGFGDSAALVDSLTAWGFTTGGGLDTTAGDLRYLGIDSNAVSATNADTAATLSGIDTTALWTRIAERIHDSLAALGTTTFVGRLYTTQSTSGDSVYTDVDTTVAGGLPAFISGFLPDSSWNQATIVQMIGGTSPVVTGVLAGTGAFGTADTAGDTSAYAAGTNCKASAIYSTVTGGKLNKATATYSAIAGGRRNSVGGTYGAICGGDTNKIATGTMCFIGGGTANSIGTGANGVITGGQNNSLGNVDNATVGGGYANNARGARSTIGGGYINKVFGIAATIAGGSSSLDSADGSGIFGSNDTIPKLDSNAVVVGYGRRSNGKNSVTVEGAGGTWISGLFVRETLLVRTGAGAAYVAALKHATIIDSCNAVDSVNLNAFSVAAEAGVSAARVRVATLDDSVFVKDGATAITTLTVETGKQYADIEYSPALNRWLIFGLR